MTGRARSGPVLLAVAAVAGGLLALGAEPPAAEAQTACRNVAIRSPVTGEAVTGLVPILGSAQIDNFNFYKVEWAPATDPNNWRAVSDTRHEPVINGLLDQWDTGRMTDGAYRLKLTVVDQSSAEICSELVEDVVVGAVNANGTATGTETATETATATATEPGEEPATATAEEATSEPVPSTDSPAPAAGDGTPEATATLAAIVPADATSDLGASLEMDSLMRAFGGGFCLALLAAAALVGYLALRGER